jgi:hypothetical protein
MANIANITPVEIAVAGAGVLLFFVCPVLLAWTDRRRRYRLQAAQARMASLAAPLSVVDVSPTEAFPITGSASAVAESMGAGSDTITAPISAPTPLSPTPAPCESVADAHAAIELRPFDGLWRYRFHLQELHEARLPDWPPIAVRDDPERARLWQEGERLCDQYRTRITAATICSPHPARSRCLGGVEAYGAKLRVHVLLFPILWPISQNQAVAQAIFEINPDWGAIEGWVDALQPHELTEDNRRDIRACGGDA